MMVLNKLTSPIESDFSAEDTWFLFILFKVSLGFVRVNDALEGNASEDGFYFFLRLLVWFSQNVITLARWLPNAGGLLTQGGSTVRDSIWIGSVASLF